jgi:threonine dehydrogenase-like Zn-dependent dehydrogenase
MKAVQITEAGKVQVADIVKPTLGAGEILLRIKYVGFCGSDLNTYLGRNPMVKMPVIPGHEVGAVIEEIGEGVPAGFEKGMNVTVNPYTNCGKCASCRNGRVNACEHNETLGVQRNGSMQEFLVLPWTKVIPAAGLSDKECALIEPMSVGFHAVSRAQVTDIDTVAVIGCGMIGLGAIVRASLRGARVIAMDIDDEKLELAKRLGASMVINSKTENVVERVRELTDGYMADVVIEAVGSPVTYVTAIDIVAFTGRVACIGYAKSEVAFQTKYFVQKELDIRGSRNAMPEDFRAVIHYLQNGNCPMNSILPLCHFLANT